MKKGVFALLTCFMLCQCGNGTDDGKDVVEEGEIVDETADWEPEGECRTDDDCSNGVVCDGVEQCVEGECRDGEALDCDDGDPCTESDCIEEEGGCVHEPLDHDGDGYIADYSPEPDSEYCGGTDCNDDNDTAYPGAERQCDNVDHDCDDHIDNDYDGDGYVSEACDGDDCDDENENINPGMEEACNSVDDDCDDEPDDGFECVMGAEEAWFAYCGFENERTCNDACSWENDFESTDGCSEIPVPYLMDPLVSRATYGFGTSVEKADIYFLVDTSARMGGEIDKLRTEFSSLIYTTIMGILSDVHFGVGRFDDYPIDPFGDEGDVSYENLHDVDSNISSVDTSLGGLSAEGGGDDPDSHVTALWTMVTGDPAQTMPAQPAPDCPEATWGYPCFREGSIPVVYLISDSPFHNAPGDDNPYSDVTAPTYSETVDALNAVGAKVIGLHTGEDASHYRQLALDTGTVDNAGDPLVRVLPNNGNGIEVGVNEEFQVVCESTPMSLSIRVRDDPSDAENALVFIDRIEPNTVDDLTDTESGITCVPGLNTADTDADTIHDTFVNVVPGTGVCFDIHVTSNDAIPSTSETQVFAVDIDLVRDDAIVLSTRRIFFVVPPT